MTPLCSADPTTCARLRICFEKRLVPCRRARERMAPRDDRPRPDAATRTGNREDTAPKGIRSWRNKDGATALLDGSLRHVSLSLLGAEIVLLDRLASDIHRVHGTWITRSGIVTALIEAAMRAEASHEDEMDG